MARRRPTPSMGELLTGEAKKQEPQSPPESQPSKEAEKKAKEKAHMKKRLPNRATYDLPPGMKDRIADIANRHGTTASQVAAFLLNRGIKQVESGSINLDKYKEPSSSIRWEHNLRIDE